MLALLCRDTILVGHSLNFDLVALRLRHLRVIGASLWGGGGVTVADIPRAHVGCMHAQSAHRGESMVFEASCLSSLVQDQKARER